MTRGSWLETVPDVERSDGVLAVEHCEPIWRGVLIGGFSQQEGAKELGHSRNKAVAEALALRVPPGYRLSEPLPRPVLEPVKATIDAWLERNVNARPRQRLMAPAEGVWFHGSLPAH